MRIYASKPTLITLVLTLALAVPSLAPSARADELVMPYSCQMVGGRPLLVAASPQTYRITGPHDQRKITICSPADPGRCRAWNVHSFNVNCGGTEVSWPAMIAGAPPARDGRARFENGRLQMSMPPAWNLPGDDPCARNMDAPAAQRDPQLDRHCQDRPDLTRPSSVEMPAGFAPTLGLDIKFNAGNNPVAAAAPPYQSPAPAPGLTAQTPAGGLTWKASPVAPPQPGGLQAGVPFDPDALTPAPKKKLPPDSKVTARVEPTLKPALPPTEQPAPARLSPVPAQSPDAKPSARPAATRPEPVTRPEPALRPEPVPPRANTIEHPTVTPNNPLPLTPPAPTATTTAPVVPALPPAPPPLDAPAKVAALPQTEPAPPPAVGPPPPPVMSVTPPQTATSQESTTTQATKITQVAENTSKQEPYSSRPQKLTPPDSGPSLTTILIAATLAITALGTFLWLRRSRDEDDLPAGPRVFAGPGFDSTYDDNTHIIPSLSGPMSADGLHRSAPAYPADPSFGPYAKHAAQEAFDDPLGPELPEWTSNDHALLEPSQSEPALAGPDLAHDWAAPHHTLEFPDRDETSHHTPHLDARPAPGSESHLVATPPVPTAPSHWAGAADWPTDMPQSHDDALHILGMGVTAKTSLPAMKKIVDGLRRSWHPDQASDDADRNIRELRIRQINTAWDILTNAHRDDGHPPVSDPL